MPIPDGQAVGQDDMMPSRQEYLVVVPAADRGAVREACDEVLSVLGPELRRAEVDAFSDYRDLDAAVAKAFDDLRARADNPRNAMAVPLDLSDATQRETLRQVAPWTIHAEVFGDGEVATFHDCGSVITAHLTQEQADALVHRLRRCEGVQVVTLEDWRRQRAGDRRRRLAAFLRRRR